MNIRKGVEIFWSNLSARQAGLRTLARFLRPHWLPAGGLLFLSILASLFETVGIGLIIPVLYALSNGQNSSPLVTGNALLDRLSYPFAMLPPEWRLEAIAVVILVLIVLKSAVTYAVNVLTSWLQVRLHRDLSLAVLDQLMGVSYRFIVDRPSGELYSYLNAHPRGTGWIFNYLVNMVSGSILVVAYCGLLVMISWQLTLVAIAFLVLLSGVLHFLARTARSLGEKINRAIYDLSQIGIELLSAMRLVRSFGREPFERLRYQEKVHNLETLNLRSSMVGGMTAPLSEVLGASLLVILFFLTSRLFVGRTQLVVPLLLTFLFVLYRLLPRVSQLNGLRIQIAMSLASADGLARTLDPSNKSYVVSGRRAFRELKKGIQFEHVTFAYKREDGAVLRDICADIPAGSTIAVVGVSGAGKSTLIDLVLRFYDPDGGRILVDGIDLREVDLRQWRRAIGVVNQDTFVFNSTVRENIAYGALEASVAEIVRAARLANIHDFIVTMPQGYETVIGDRGLRLSAGQRQRIAIARALVRNPQFLILDEATSMLDSESESLIHNSIEGMRENRTVLIIAHRMSTVRMADQVLVLEGGRVIERGTHDELLSQRGRYHTLWSLQDGDARRGAITMAAEKVTLERGRL